jgi:hypothetical protein
LQVVASLQLIDQHQFEESQGEALTNGSGKKGFTVLVASGDIEASCGSQV